MDSSTYDAWHQRIDDAVDLTHGDEHEAHRGVQQLESCLADLDREVRRAAGTDVGRWDNLAKIVTVELAGVYAMQHRFQPAYDLLSADTHVITPRATQNRVRQRAYLLHQMGRTDEAGALLTTLLESGAAKLLIEEPEAFFALLRYRLFDRAQAWLDRTRALQGVETWRQPDAQGMLHRYEASLRLERGEAERALVSYDKAARLMGGNASPTNLAVELVIAGRPNLALRLWPPAPHDPEDLLWRGLALRAVGRDAEAARDLQRVADEDASGDDYSTQFQALARAYLQQTDAAYLGELVEIYVDEPEFVAPIAFAVAIVASLQGEDDLAEEGLADARDDLRRDMESDLLNRTHWFHARALLAPEQQARYAHFFDPTLMAPQYI